MSSRCRQRSATPVSAAGVLYVTERAVFRPLDDRLELIEIAPGIDLQEQVLKQMPSRRSSAQVRTMPATSLPAERRW